MNQGRTCTWHGMNHVSVRLRTDKCPQSSHGPGHTTTAATAWPSQLQGCTVGQAVCSCNNACDTLPICGHDRLHSPCCLHEYYLNKGVLNLIEFVQNLQPGVQASTSKANMRQEIQDTRKNLPGSSRHNLLFAS